MQDSGLYRILKIVSYVVLGLGGAAICYAAVIAGMYWSGIGV
ncbi:hypothetical protein [Pollutimonas subterranea]|nr:hypothetical protein [Pollutimonas subterranea]